MRVGRGFFWAQPTQVDPRHAWTHFDALSKYSIPMEIHPRMAWIYCVDQGRHLPTAAPNALPTAR
ncbi:hypothetical protein TEP_04185 [Stenotrophomonas sp. TEPEL]|nr:hypothetical protein TEP_04185 [Stenotrophomonas sp. TEPEL]